MSSGWKIYQPDQLPCLVRTDAAVQELCDAVKDRVDRLNALGFDLPTNHETYSNFFRKSPTLSPKIAHGSTNPYSYGLYLNSSLAESFMLPEQAEEILRATEGTPAKYAIIAGSASIYSQWDKYTNDRKFPQDIKLFYHTNEGTANDARMLHAYYRLINDMIYYLTGIFYTNHAHLVWENVGIDLFCTFGKYPTSDYYNFHEDRLAGRTCYVNVYDDVQTASGSATKVTSIPVTPTTAQMDDTEEANQSFVASLQGVFLSYAETYQEKTWNGDCRAGYSYDGDRYYSKIRSSLSDIYVAFEDNKGRKDISIKEIFGIQVLTTITKHVYYDDDWHNSVLFDGACTNTFIPDVSVPAEGEVYISDDTRCNVNFIPIPQKLNTPYYHEPQEV